MYWYLFGQTKISGLESSKYFSALQSNRLDRILESVSSVHDLCSVLSMDFVGTVTEVHPSLDDSVGVQSKSISDDTLSKLSKMVIGLQEEKLKRFSKVICIGGS